MTTLVLYGLPSIVDERCLYSLFNHKVKQALFSGFDLGRLAIVELSDDALTSTILRQSCAGLILANSLNAKKAQRAIRANAKKEAEEAKAAKKKGRKGGEEKEKSIPTDSLDDPSKGITLLELLQQELGGGFAAPSAVTAATSSSAAVAKPAYMAQFGDVTPEFGLYSTILINGYRVGIAVSPLSIEEFKNFGGEMATRPPPRPKKENVVEGEAAVEGGSADGPAPRKQRRTEAPAHQKSEVSEEKEAAAISVPAPKNSVAVTSSFSSSAPQPAGKKEVVLQSTRMRNVNHQAPAFGATAKTSAKITFSDDDDDDDASKKKKDSNTKVIAKEAEPVPDKKKKEAVVENNDAPAAAVLNNRERKKLAKASAATTTTSTKFKFADSDSD